MKIIRASSFSDYEWIRNTRNRNRQYMTGYNQFITPFEQFRFMIKSISSDLPLYIYEDLIANNLNKVGFLLLRTSNQYPSRYELTICISEPYWNRGYGKQFLTWACSLSLPLISFIYSNNQRSISIHKSCGFNEIMTTVQPPSIVTYAYDPS